MKDTSANLIERYLTELSDIRATRAHVPETSFYPALEGLLNDVGKTLAPKVRCVINIQNRGAGLPDGGLFTADQFRRRTADPEEDANPFLHELPARGVIEAKPPAEDIRSVAETEQVGRYWKRYGVVLVTSFRAFALVAKDVSGRPVILESFSLGESEGDFWRLTAHPRKTGGEQGARMVEYLRRVLLHNAPLALRRRTWRRSSPPMPAMPWWAWNTPISRHLRQSVRRSRRLWACALKARRASTFSVRP